MKSQILRRLLNSLSVVILYGFFNVDSSAAPLATDGSVTFQVTTVSYGGNYAQKNVGAIWVEDTQNRFVKTMKLWADKRKKHLVKWNAASAANVIDAVTGATVRAHQMHSATWDCKDTNGLTVGDGVYRIYVEFTEDNSAGGPPGKWFVAEFTKGSTSQSLTFPDQPNFRGMQLEYVAGGAPPGPSPASLAGTVKDASTSSALATVTVQLKTGAQVSYETTTNASGSFSFSSVQAATYTLAATKAGYTTSSESITLTDGQQMTGKNILLSPVVAATATLSGSVLDAASRVPIQNVSVQLKIGNQISYQTQSNSSGAYNFSSVQAGSYTLVASKSGYGNSSENLSISSGQNITGKEILLTANILPGSLSGTVVETNSGLPIQNAIVQLKVGSQVRYETTTNTSGSYSIANIDPATYTLAASKTGYSPSSENLDVSSGQSITGREIRLTSNILPGSLSGTVVETNSTVPIPNAVVQLKIGSQVRYEATTNASGNYSIAAIDPAAYTLVASKTGYSSWSENLNLGSGQQITNKSLNLTPVMNGASVSGHIATSGSNAPIENATIQLKSGGQVKYQTTTGSAGDFVFNEVQAGSYSLVASKNGYSIWNENINVIAGQPVSGKQIVLIQTVTTATLSGKVFDADSNQPLAGATLQLKNGVEVKYEKITNSTGDFVFNEVLAGSYSLVAFKDGYLDWNENVSIIAGQPITGKQIVLVQPITAATLSGIVLDAGSNQPLAGVTVQLKNGVEVNYEKTTDTNGAYSVDSVLPASYELTASKDGYEPWSEFIDFASGQQISAKNLLLNVIAVADTTAPDPPRNVRVRILGK